MWCWAHSAQGTKVLLLKPASFRDVCEATSNHALLLPRVPGLTLEVCRVPRRLKARSRHMHAAPTPANHKARGRIQHQDLERKQGGKIAISPGCGLTSVSTHTEHAAGIQAGSTRGNQTAVQKALPIAAQNPLGQGQGRAAKSPLCNVKRDLVHAGVGFSTNTHRASAADCLCQQRCQGLTVHPGWQDESSHAQQQPPHRTG